MRRRAPSIAAALGALALLAGLAGLSWLAARQERLDGATRVALASAAPRMAATGGPALSFPTLPSTAAAVPDRARAIGPDEVEICGYGVAKAGSEAAGALEAQAQEGWERATQSHFQRMLASADSQTRAAALMVSFQFAPLVELALRTSDPTIYAMALAACDRRAVEPAQSQACQMVNAEQGARLDVDNAAAWFSVAGQAAARGEPEAVAAALHRASVATRLHYRTAEFAALAIAAMPEPLPRAEQAQILVAAIGIQAALSMPQYQVLTRHCDEARVRDSNHRQTCSALAELLVTKGPTLLDLRIGRRIGERVGWPLERTEQLGAMSEALMQAVFDELTSAPGGSLSCASAERYERWWRAQSPGGERAAAEQIRARSGLSQAQLMERYRRQKQQRFAMAAAEAASEAVAAAASAASAPR